MMKLTEPVLKNLIKEMMGPWSEDEEDPRVGEIFDTLDEAVQLFPPHEIDDEEMFNEGVSRAIEENIVDHVTHSIDSDTKSYMKKLEGPKKKRKKHGGRKHLENQISRNNAIKNEFLRRVKEKKKNT